MCHFYFNEFDATVRPETNLHSKLPRFHRHTAWAIGHTPKNPLHASNNAVQIHIVSVSARVIALQRRPNNDHHVV